MNEFINIMPENHDQVLREIPGKLYIVYFSRECIFCRQAIMNLINMPENPLFTFAVCQVDGHEEFRMKEGLLSLPTTRIYENGIKTLETNGYNQTYGAYGEMRSSIEKAENFHPVYADNAATTKMSRKALKAFCDCAKNEYGNPSTNYAVGLEARARLTWSRSVILDAFHLQSGKVIFTGGGSEADNQALYSATREGLKQNRKHIITSAVEHHAVLHTLEKYKEEGFDVTVLSVNALGQVCLKELEQAIRPETILVSIMYANNETGTIQPVREIAGICKKHGVLYHCDAVQAAGHVDIDLSLVKADYLSIAAHKFNGPKGIGALIIPGDAPVSSLLLGGGQESGHRAGTENVQAIYAMAVALNDHITHLKRNAKKTRAMTDSVVAALAGFPGVRFNGHPENRLPGTVNLSFSGIGGRELLFLLDAKYGICVSGGSACNTASAEPSHVLTAMGLSKAEADSAVRISLNQDNTPEDADYIVNALENSVAYLRARQTGCHQESAHSVL